MPVLIWCEYRTVKRYGYLPGAVWRFAVVALIVTAAVMQPFKWNDFRVAGLPTASPTLGELAAARVILLGDESLKERQVALPSTKPTRKEVTQAIREMDLRASMVRCGLSDGSILFGPKGVILVKERAPLPSKKD